MQDNAPSHKGHTLKFLQQNKIEFLEWPPQSPDMNPIELVWMWMENIIYDKSFKNKQELTDFVFELWNKIPDTIILNFIDKVFDKMDRIRNNNGEIYRP